MKTVPLTGDRLSIGRSSAAELCFSHEDAASRVNISRSSPGRGLDSAGPGQQERYGTFVNNIPLKAKLNLQPGDRITAGHLVIVFEPDAADPARAWWYSKAAMPIRLARLR